MAGDGEGLVAIVESLDPAGVTLTVCNRSRHNSDRRRCSRSRIQINSDNTRTDIPAADLRSITLPANSAPLANHRSSVETSTGTDFSRQHRSSQICDGRYASSYKLAHCMVTPTSPPEAVSEFPPQRKEPCRNQGNFEIGGHGSGQWNCHGSGQGSGYSSGKLRVSSSRVRHNGGSHTWAEKGTSHRYCKSNRDTEAFAHSLRKYPSMAPFRTASTDLIEKLIRYTQAKNFQELSRTTKSMRSLRQQKSSDNYDMAKASKHQQTYTRRQDDDNVANSNVQVGSRGRTRNFKLYSPVSDSRSLKVARQRDATFSSSYDYLKAAGSPYERSYHCDKSPSPVESSSPERTRSPEVSRSPVRFKSTDGFRSPDRPNRVDRSIRFKRSVRDLSLSDMSKYIRSTIRQICNERPVVFQVCPELQNRFHQHRQVCSNKNDRPRDVMDDELEEDQVSGSVLSRLIQSFSRCAEPSTEQSGCQCTRTDCYCSKATQCVNNPDASTNTKPCSCKTPTNSRCCRGMPCACANKVQDQAYYNKRIDEEISEWLKDVPVHSSDSKKKRETVIKELRKTLKLLPDDDNFGDNAENEIKSFVDDFPLWNPGKDKKDEKLFKNQLADKLTERIVSIPRKPDRFRDIVKKWIVDMDFEDDGEDVDKETIIDKVVDKLKSLAAERPACDIKYTNTLRKEIIELLVELALKFDGDILMLKKIANKLATEIVTIPRNVNLSGDTTDLTDEFEENLSDWICQHGLCGELKKDPKLIKGLAKKLNKLKSQGIDDECVVEKMKAEIHQFVDDVGIVIETMDELIDELMKQLSNTVETNEMEKMDEVTEISTDWLRNLPGGSDLDPRKFEKIIKELVKMIIEGKELGNEDLANDILNYLVGADLSIDAADLVIYVEELMEKLNILPSQKYHKEQVKKAMVKDIFDIIENLSMPQNKTELLKSKAHEILEYHLNNSALNSKDDHDDVMERIMGDMDDFIGTIKLPNDSRFVLKNSLSKKLSSNFDKSFMRLRRLSEDESNLKQTIAKDIRNSVKELPIDLDKMKDLMQQVKETLSKSMHKPLPSNVKNTINDEISDIVERCPISKDKSIVGSLKKMLSAVASKHLNICLPKCVCDIQSKVEKDVGIVIDKSSIDTRTKKELKKSIQDILAENEDRNLSDEVLRSIKKNINGVVSDLSIPQDKKNVLKTTVSETISKDFNDALANLKHDLNKVRNKLFEDICNAIEKSPIPRVVKTQLINKLKSVLAVNIDSSLSDEEKYTILDDVSNIVKDDMPAAKRISLTNKLAKKLDTQQRKEIDQLTKNLKELEDKLLDYILREMEQVVEEAPISSERKIELKKKLKNMATIDYNKPAEDIAEVLVVSINEILDELNLPKDKTNEIKNELAAAIDEYSKLLRQIKDIESEYDRHNQQIGKGLMPIEEFDENKARQNILQGIEDIIDESVVPEEKKMEFKRKLKKMATDNLKKPFNDDVQDAIKMGIADILDELQIPKSEKNKLKRELIKMTDKNLDNLREAKQPAGEFDEYKARQNILQGIEKIIEESAIPEEKKMELKQNLKKMATDNLKKPFSDDVQDAIKMGIADVLDELQIPKSEKNKLKRELIKMTDKNLDNLREATQPAGEFDEYKARQNILQGIEKIIEESAIPEEKKMELKQNLKKMATDNLKKPFSDDVQDAIKMGIADILDDLQIPKSQKNKLKRALINMTDKNLDNLREAKQPAEEFDEYKARQNILQGIEKIIEESAIPEEKKMELKQNLKKMATDNLKKPFSDDVQDAIKMGIAHILDEMQILKSEKNKLKRELIKMTDKNLDNLREAKQPAEEFDEYKARQNILQGIEKIIEGSAIPEEKKMELKQNLKIMATDNLKKPFSDDVQDAIKMGIADILDDLQIPKSEKNKLKRALINMTHKNLDNLREAKQPAEEFDEYKARQNILQGIEKIIEESAIPEEKKMELKQNLKIMATDNLKKPFSDDVQDAIKMGIADILDDLQIPKSEKNKLKRALINMTDKNLDNLREAKQPAEEFDEYKARQNILQGIEKIIEESAIPEEKKMELKQNLKKMATDNLKKPFSDDVQDAIKMGIADILDDLQIPKSEKNKLKRELIKMTDKHLDNLREAKQPAQEFDDPKARKNILQGIEKIIEESAIPEEKKMDLKSKLKKLATDNLKKPFSDDVQDAIKMGIADILDDLQIPKSEKNKLKRALINMTHKNLDNLREAKQPAEEFDEYKARQNILQGIEKIIEESAIPEEKKMELKQNLKIMATDNLKKPFSDDVQDAIKMGIADILDDLQIPKSEKNKLKRALINMTDKNLDNLREAKQPAEEFDEYKARQNILQGIEKIIEESAIPEEKKMELKQNLKKMATDNFKKPFSDDVQDAIKMGIADILDDLQIPKSEKNKLKRELIKMTDKHLDNLREAKQPAQEFDDPKARKHILQGIEKIIEESAIPEEKKMDLKSKLKKLATDNLKKPFSNDVQDSIKMGIADILDELQIPKSEKNKLKRELIKMTDKHLDNLQEAKQPAQEFDDPKARKNILQGIEKIIEESAIPEEKKMDLKSKLKKLATDNLKKPFSNDVQDSIKMGIADILDELQIPKSEKNKLKRELIKMTDKNLDNLREAKQPAGEFDEPKARQNILQGIENIIEESAIPEEKKMELKQNLKKMATDNLKKPFSDDVQDGIKMGIADILDDLQIPKSEKNKLKRALINMTNKNLDNLREPKQVRSAKSLMPITELDETNAKERVLQGIEKIIEESTIPENKKMELKRKLKKMTTDNLKKPFNDDVHDAIKMGIADTLDELQIPNSEKNKLKRALVNIVDENVDNLRGIPPKLSSQVDDFKELKSEGQNDNLLALEKAIDKAPIALDKKREFTKKLKNLATKNFQKPLSDDTAETLQDGKKERKKEVNSAKSMPDEKRNKLNIIIRRVLPEFDEAVDPSYQKQLAEDFDELLEIAVTDGDFKDARKKLIKKLMREQNLSEKEANASVDELIGRAREMALKDGIGNETYELDPKYVKTLEPDINELVDIALVGGDFEDARRKLIKKLMRDQNLPEEKASACADDLIGKAQKLALAAQSKDKSHLFKEALTKAINNAVDQTTMSKPDKSSVKNKLISKLKQTLDKKPFINKDDLEPLKSKVLKDLIKIVDELSIPTDKKNELQSLMNENLANTIDEIMDEYDIEEGYTKPYTKAISKAVNKSPIPNLEKINLKKDLAKTFDGILDDFDNKITKHKEALARAINDAVDQSTLSKPNKSSLKNKLLNKMKRTVDESPHINDTGALKAEVLKDCKNVVDDSSIPIREKSELKLLLKEEIMDDYDDEEKFAMEGSPKSEDKFKKCKEAFARAINDAVDQSTLSKPDKSSQKNKLLSKLNQTMANSPNLNDIGALTGEILKDSKNVVDESSIPIGKKRELKSLLQEALAGGTAKELMDDYDDEETFAKEESQENEDKLKKYKESFAKAINGAVDQSTLSKPDKNGQKNKLLSKLNETIDNTPNLNDIGALIAEILKDSKKVVDTSSIPTEKKNELKLLLQEALAGAAKELMDDEEVSREAFTTFQDKIAETVKTWMDSLPIDLDPNVTTAAVAKDIASDILDRLKYLQLHPETITTDKDEIENLKYQIFRRMKNFVDLKDIPPIMEGTEELYRMIMEIEPPPGFPKLRREQSTSERWRRDPVSQEKKKSTSTAFSTGNINHSLKELIATSKSIRRQWSKNLDEAVTKLPLPRKEKCFLKEKLAIYDESSQGRMLSTKSKSKEETVQRTKLKKNVAPTPAPKSPQKNNKAKLSSRLSKIDRALTFNNTMKQKSPFNPKKCAQKRNPTQGVDEKQFTKFVTDTIKAWLEKVQVNIEPKAKNRIIEELTNDVIDRKKYMQVYGSVEPTRTDDLDYLKLQVHRRLSAFVPAEALKAVIVDTKVLLATIDTVTMKTTSESEKNAKSPVSQKTGNKQGMEQNETEQELSNIEFSPRKTSTPGKSNGEPTPEEYKNNVAETIKTWIESVHIELEPAAETDFIDELTNDIVDRKKYLQVQPDKMVSKKEEIENLRFQVFKRLINADPDASETPDIEMVEDLYRMIGEGQRRSLSPKQAEEFRTALNAEISAILDDYNICCDRRDLHPSLANELTKLAKNNADQDEIVENLIDTIKRLTYLSPCLCDEEAEELAHKLLYKTKKLIARIQERDRQIAPGTAVKKKDFKEAVMNDIGDVFDGVPMSNEKRSLMENQLAEDYAKDLGIPLEESDVTMKGTGPESTKAGYGMSFNGLTNFIDTWLSSIHTDDDTKGEDEIKDMKKDMAHSLIHKIGEMNVDPEIFNDDSLYEAILRDELQNVLGDITISDDDIQALKEDLIEKVLEAQHRAHDEIAGQIYKKNLRDTISKLLPDQRNLSKEEQDSMETLKDQLADAYIDLHYSGGNENQRERSKKKIADEINNFCRDYLYRNPCSPLNSRTLNQNLYNALNKVPLPKGDSIRYEVEQARIREEINEWIKELPLQPQNPTEVLARNKLVYLLSKKLFDIELEGDDTDNELMKKEIVKFLNKIPLESEEDKDTLADKLIDKLKATQELRKYNASSNVTLDAFGNVSTGSNGGCMDAPICQPYRPLATPPCFSDSPKVCRQPKPFPPCTLSPEDRAHLERIKRRTCLSPNCVSTFTRKNKRNTGVGPRPVDAGSQTVLRPFGMETQQRPICSINNERPRPCPGLSTNLPQPPCSHMRRNPCEIEKPPPSPVCPAAHETTSRPCHGPCPHTRRDPCEIEKPPPSPICSASHENASRPCPGPSRPSLQNGHHMRRHTISSGNIESPIEEEVQPQIIIKQYYWNPNEKNSVVDSDLQQNGRSSRRQSSQLPCHQPGPCHQAGSPPCEKSRTSSYAQATPAPCHHSSFGKLQQQNTSPQRMPYDKSFTSSEPKSQQQPSPERYSYWDPQSSFQGPSQRDLPSEESSFTPSPCMSPFCLNQQPSPPCSPGFSKREHEYRIPKRDGLQDQMPCSSRPCRKKRVIELGSLDDVPNARPKTRHSDQSDWPYTKFQEDDNFWGLPMRRVILDEGINESVVMEREQREERIRCRCKERLIPKNSRSQPRTCPSQEIPKNGRSQPRTCPSQEIPQDNEDEQNLRKCSKCCGRHCPYPSFLYFRQ